MMALFVISAVLGIIGTLMVDILYSVVDPRVRYDRRLHNYGPGNVKPATERAPGEARKAQTYWGAVLTKLWRDKLTVLGIFLLVLMVTTSVAAPWIGNNVLGFSPTKNNFRGRSAPPTWAEESWLIFQEFSHYMRR